MPDVGVLSLQIQDNSQKAIDGLSALEGVLVRVRNAVGDGMKLSTVAVGLKRIGTVVNENISGSTLVKIGQLADELSKLNGLGSLKITVSGTGAVESVAETVRKAEDSITGINTGFEDVGARVAEARDEMDDYSESAREASEATKDLRMAVRSKMPQTNLHIIHRVLNGQSQTLRTLRKRWPNTNSVLRKPERSSGRNESNRQKAVLNQQTVRSRSLRTLLPV